MHGVLSSQYHGTGTRDEIPWEIPGMLYSLVKQQQRAFLQIQTAAQSCTTLAPPLVMKHLREIASDYTENADPKVEFVDRGPSSRRLVARVRSTGSIHERAVDIGSDPATCSCAAAHIDKFPCACMVIVADKAGVDPCTLLSDRHLTSTWQDQYRDTPRYIVPSTENLEMRVFAEDLLPPVALSQKAGRPSTKRKQCAIDELKKSARQDREVKLQRAGLVPASN